MPEARGRAADPELSVVVTTLMKGPVYRDQHERIWRQLTLLQGRVQDFVSVLGLVSVIDDVEGYAYLRSRPEESGEDDAPAAESIPRLVRRTQLTFGVSLLLALLRKRLAEFDAGNAGTRLVLRRDQVADMLTMFVPAGGNEARIRDQVDAHIAKAVELSFLRKLPDDTFEVRRILKAFVDAQWLHDFDERLAAYADDLGASGEPS